MKKTNKTPQEIYNLKTQLKFKKLSTIKRQGEILKKMKYEWGLRQLKNKGDYGFLTLEHFVQGEYVLTVKYKFTKIEKYLYEVNKLNLEKENLSKSKINSYNLDWINQFKKIGKLQEIDRNIVDCFIENIYVNDDKSVEILFRYIEQYKFALEYLKSQNDMI